MKEIKLEINIEARKYNELTEETVNWWMLRARQHKEVMHLIRISR